MDTSKEYIEMCKGAVEIQEAWNPKEGDFMLNLSAVGGPYLFTNYKYQPNSNNNRWELEVYERLNHLLWLPRQDQLQELVAPLNFDITFRHKGKGSKTKNIYVGFAIKHTHSPEHEYQILNRMATMEQLWLAFVMKEKYQKAYLDDEWVEI
jgi:hypothetical protein